MPHYKKRERARDQQLWENALPVLLAQARRDAGLQPDEHVPDGVLLAEAAHYFGIPGLWAPRKWFELRIAGAVNGEVDRASVAGALHSAQASRPVAHVPWGLGQWPRTVTTRSRRGAPPRAIGG
jgi:hypothetical protein